MSAKSQDFGISTSARSHVLGLSVLSVALLVSGCASSRSPSFAQVGAQVEAPAPVRAKVEVEDDGVPVQSPPLRRARTEPDDPNEPFSRNYGTSRPAVTVRKADVRQPAPRATTTGYDSTFDEDGIIARAIAAHEARVQ